MKASILAVGTEITSGQITNRNAAWISHKLTELGLPTSLHMSVPDDRKLILEALQILENQSDFIFVTGGLGPTSDDFTRDLISEWSQCSLEFDEASWEKIKTRLSLRGLPIGDFQKQQCYFPKGSKILNNSHGTANAFYLQKNSRHVWVLPGPPNEIQVVWTDFIHDMMKSLTQGLDPLVTFSWDLLGIGEAQAPSLIEPVVAGSDLEVGYRVHLPYLEIKLTFLQSQMQRMQSLLQMVDDNLRSHTVSRNGENIVDRIKPVLEKNGLAIFDEVTQGALLSRLSMAAQKNFTYSTSRGSSDHPLQVHCSLHNNSDLELILYKNGQICFQSFIPSPSSFTAQMSERRRLYFAERAVIAAVQNWSSS